MHRIYVDHSTTPNGRRTEFSIHGLNALELSVIAEALKKHGGELTQKSQARYHKRRLSSTEFVIECIKGALLSPEFKAILAAAKTS